MVYIAGKEAIIVSTPDSDAETQHLIDWVKKKKKAKIVGYIIDRWHPDAMEGLDIVHKNGIKTYAYELTRKIAKEKGLPIPKVGFKDKLELTVGGQKVIGHFLGEAHTSDGIVVWVPGEKVLFGGNEIRSRGGWLGNIADANLSEWSNTAKRIKKYYGQAKYVIPGHGQHGSTQLIDYTIALYSFPKNIPCQDSIPSDTLIKESMDGFHFVAIKKQQTPDKVTYLNGKVSFTKKGKQIEIRAQSMKYTPAKKSLYIPTGYVQLKYKNRTESFSFNRLYVNLREDEVEFTLVIKEVK
ncbi:hypothetical protein BKI52_39905 [marine bacterium AO1-C]|nr:hypothetical protein BKI52_39905 [marine bacterium AO1-C]